MRNEYEALITEARELEMHIDTEWAETNAGRYDDFANTIEDKYAAGLLTDAEFNSLASIAFFDYPDGLKGDDEDEELTKQELALAQPIAKYHVGACRRREGERSMIRITAEDRKTIFAVFSDLLQKKYNELNTFMGSETITRMQQLHNKLYYEDYCNRHQIRYEDLTEADYEQAYYEKWEE